MYSAVSGSGLTFWCMQGTNAHMVVRKPSPGGSHITCRSCMPWSLERYWVAPPGLHPLLCAAVKVLSQPQQLVMDGKPMGACPVLANLRTCALQGTPSLPLAGMLEASIAAGRAAFPGLQPQPLIIANASSTAARTGLQMSTALRASVDTISGTVRLASCSDAQRQTDCMTSRAARQVVAVRHRAAHDCLDTPQAVALTIPHQEGRQLACKPQSGPAFASLADSQAGTSASACGLYALESATALQVVNCQGRPTANGNVLGTLVVGVGCFSRDFATSAEGQAGNAGAKILPSITACGDVVAIATDEGGKNWLSGVQLEQIRPPPADTVSTGARSPLLSMGWVCSEPTNLKQAQFSAAGPAIRVCARKITPPVIAALQYLHGLPGAAEASSTSRCLGCGTSAPPSSSALASCGPLPGLLRAAALELPRPVSGGATRESLDFHDHLTSNTEVRLSVCRPCPDQDPAPAGPYGIRVSGGCELMPRMVMAASPVKLAHSSEHPGSIRSSHRSLVTGGTGMIGGLVGAWLAQRGASEVVLLSRSGRLVGGGLSWAHEGTMEVTKCDLGAHEDAADAAIRAASWPHVSLVHAGGVLADASLQKQTVRSVRSVFSPKVTGLLCLQKFLDQQATEAQVLFSSIAGLWGSPGQLQYSAANSTLDGVAEVWRQAGKQTISVNWGAWSGGGMASKATAARLAKAGLGMLKPAAGLQSLASATASASGSTAFLPAVAVTPVDWPVFLGRMGRAVREIFGEMDGLPSEPTAEQGGAASDTADVPRSIAHSQLEARQVSEAAPPCVAQRADMLPEVRSFRSVPPFAFLSPGVPGLSCRFASPSAIV